ncbi:TetR/AcrR family transcriptional regulator [Rhodohalobacter sulfatireducens]|uniref:TetR/AcrR family transcriptional regulator n=1 Tax=Rhodohalobacter sulfatireducens TaxID=2911366 RepID=A0ABS9KIJ1_9BACT|nr:TetR/AcrR family transcriptional regulator [Rhodohalobacter sulfatireducens]MCG2590646.1 TetR/AcrR family transcriptional regulator [Rhodohalobacter sulfatireducens]
MPLEKQTEEQIFLAAQRVFQEKGFAGARMQEIADEADINKSMLHYYYRSKEKLFLEVFQSSVKKVFPQLIAILSSGDELEAKVKKVVEFYYNTFRKNPYLPSFVLHEMNQHPKRFKEFINSQNIRIPKEFAEQLETEIEKGRIMPMKPTHFLINIVSLCLMPVIARTLVQTLFSLDDDDFDAFLAERKELIPKVIFSGVQT